MIFIWYELIIDMMNCDDMKSFNLLILVRYHWWNIHVKCYTVQQHHAGPSSRWPSQLIFRSCFLLVSPADSAWHEPEMDEFKFLQTAGRTWFMESRLESSGIEMKDLVEALDASLLYSTCRKKHTKIHESSRPKRPPKFHGIQKRIISLEMNDLHMIFQDFRMTNDTHGRCPMMSDVCLRNAPNPRPYGEHWVSLSGRPCLGVQNGVRSWGVQPAKRCGGPKKKSICMAEISHF